VVSATARRAWISYQVGHPAKIRQADTRKQKHDRRDAELLLNLLVTGRFPTIWQPTREDRDLRALLLHRHQWVRLRTRVQNALQAVALGQGLRRGGSLWSRAGQAALASRLLPPHAGHRRDELQALYRHLKDQIDDLDARVADQARRRQRSALLMTHPGVGPVTALATDVFLATRRGSPTRKPLPVTSD
jgi:transposase